MTTSSEYGPDDTGPDEDNDQAPAAETAAEYGDLEDEDPGPFDVPIPPDHPNNEEGAPA